MRSNQSNPIADPDLVNPAPARYINLEEWLTSSSIDIYRHAQCLSDREWYDVLCASVTGEPFHGLVMPYFIDQDQQRNFVGSFGVAALTEAFNFIRILRHYLDNYRIILDSDTHVLDFGCGWGRYTRFMLRYAHPDNIFGFDVDTDMIERCKKTFGCCNFITVKSFPPSPVRDGLFNIIFAYSVFSHLSEAAANAWIQEFARITRPGGIVFLTTQGRTFIDFCREIRESGKFEHSWHYNLAKSFVDIEKAKQNYDAGNFLYAATGGGNSREASFYGEAIIPKGYIERCWTEHFELLDFIDDRSILPQALIVLKRRSATAVTAAVTVPNTQSIQDYPVKIICDSHEYAYTLENSYGNLRHLDSFLKQDLYDQTILGYTLNQQKDESCPYNYKVGTLSECGNVIVGYEGWLYLLSGTNSWMDQYVGKIRLEHQQIQNRVNLLSDRAQNLNKMGIAYCHLIIPEKLCVHPEFFPEKLSIKANRAAIQLIEENIPNLLYPLEVLQKYQGFIPLWFKGNSHWNIYGCFIVYCEILKKLEIDFEPIFENLLTGIQISVHDLVIKFSNYNERHRFFKSPAIEIYNNKLWDTIKQHQGNHYILKNPSAIINKNICIFGDSYSFDAGLSYLFSNHFSEVHFIWDRDINYKYCREIGAHYVVTEITERLTIL